MDRRTTFTVKTRKNKKPVFIFKQKTENASALPLWISSNDYLRADREVDHRTLLKRISLALTRYYMTKGPDISDILKTEIEFGIKKPLLFSEVS